jgi:putative transcriptional regulator
MYWKNKPELDSYVESYRKKSKLTQAELSLKCRVTRQTIIAIEKGNYIPSVALALILAEVLETNVEKLFMLKGTNK